MIVVIYCAVQSETRVPLKQYDGDSKINNGDSKINIFAADPLVGVHFICDRVTWSNYNQCLLVTSFFISPCVAGHDIPTANTTIDQLLSNSFMNSIGAKSPKGER